MIAVASGLVLLIGAAWVITQVLKGHALERLGILQPPEGEGG